MHIHNCDIMIKRHPCSITDVMFTVTMHSANTKSRYHNQIREITARQ